MTITETIRDVIRTRELTAYRVAKDAKLAPNVVQRFMDGTDLRGKSLDKIATSLGLTLVCVDIPDTRP